MFLVYVRVEAWETETQIEFENSISIWFGFVLGLFAFLFGFVLGLFAFQIFF